MIICEAIEDAQTLHTVLQVHPLLKLTLQSPQIVLYDRSYIGSLKDKLRILPNAPASDPEKLGLGTVVIGTNIIGRGTDVGISLELQRNGGIHLITQYLPSNERVAAQAMGRTARGGLPGTGRYNFDW